jgi:hypothetical protein
MAMSFSAACGLLFEPTADELLPGAAKVAFKKSILTAHPDKGGALGGFIWFWDGFDWQCFTFCVKP